MTWWSLTCNIAREWRTMMAEARSDLAIDSSTAAPNAFVGFRHRSANVINLRDVIRAKSGSAWMTAAPAPSRPMWSTSAVGRSQASAAEAMTVGALPLHPAHCSRQRCHPPEGDEICSTRWAAFALPALRHRTGLTGELLPIREAAAWITSPDGLGLPARRASSVSMTDSSWSQYAFIRGWGGLGQLYCSQLKGVVPKVDLKHPIEHCQQYRICAG
jgi:hypothetical protein